LFPEGKKEREKSRLEYFWRPAHQNFGSLRSKSEFDLQIFQILKLENCKAGVFVREKICPKMTSTRKISQISHAVKKKKKLKN